MKALVFTPPSLFQLSQFAISQEWFSDFGLAPNTTGLRRTLIDDLLYIVESNLNTDDGPIIVVNLDGPNSIFSPGEYNTSALDRIIHVARFHFSSSVAIPSQWRPYRDGHQLSISVTARDDGWRARVYFDRHPNNTRDLLVYARTPETVDFSRLSVPLALHARCRQKLADCILAPVEVAPQNTSAGIVLTQRLPQGFVQGASLQQWYTSKLTNEQRAFVDKPYEGPVRLRGAAGTGKTLSLVVKLLRDGVEFERTSREVRLGFLTHSLASVDLVSAIAESLDTGGLLSGYGKSCKVEVRTLYDLAHEHLRVTLDELQPLSLDGREGRLLQRDLIKDVLVEMSASRIVKAQYSAITPELHAQWESPTGSGGERFVAEIVNEFASVLDAEGIRAGEERAERYAKSAAQRPPWLMPLPQEVDRRFVLEIHRRYRKLLGEMNTLSVDQLVADFNAFLDSNRWDRMRERVGYDALFVDELHLFTSIERQILHKLIKRSLDEQGVIKRPPIFMAYDLKQSPRDTFASYGEGDTNLFSVTTGLQNSDLVKLNQVFRYTPQIADFLSDLDAAFPAIDIPGEWNAYVGEAKLADGGHPELTIYKDEVSLFRDVMESAISLARSAPGGGRRVAVLCPSEFIFDRYVKAASGQFEGKIFPITGREPSSDLRHAGKRFIFSMPEYVAGLQFETVFLIHIDAAESPMDGGIGVRRRFISSVYLGSSRAEETLRISSCLTRGGPSDILDMALNRGSLTRNVRQ